MKREKISSKEEGNFVDQMAGVFTMMVLFALVMAILAYSSLAEKRLSISNAVRNYLYIAEQQGGLTANDVQSFESFLFDNYGCTNIDIEINGAKNWISGSGTSYQVPYGSDVRLSVEMDFPNPIYKVLGLSDEQIANGGGDKYWFRAPFPRSIHYSKDLTSTSRW